MEPSDAVWKKSSLSVHDDCVEVAFVDGKVAVRHSKSQAGPVLLFSQSEWRAFVGGVRNGELSLPD